MNIHLEKRAINIWIKAVVYAIVAGTVAIVVIMTDILGDGLLGLSRFHWAGIVVLLYLLYYFYQNAMDYNYVYFSDEEDKLILRYYKLLKMNSDKMVIEIPKHRFYNYEIKKTRLQNKEYLILYQSMDKGVAKYPPASVSLLTSDEKNKLYTALNQVLETYAT